MGLPSFTDIIDFATDYIPGGDLIDSALGIGQGVAVNRGSDPRIVTGKPIKYLLQ